MEYNDYELLDLIHEGNEQALDIIYNKYKPLIVKKSKEAIVFASHHGIDINDIMQEGYIGLDEAINNFVDKDTASFYTFAILCINRQIINYVRKTTGGKEKILNDAIVIDDYIEKMAKDKRDVEISFLSRDGEERMIENILNELTPFEKNVFELRISGYTFEEIANTLNRDLKSIYNTFHRIKQKIKKIIENDN